MWQPYAGEGVQVVSVGVLATQQNCFDWADTLGLTYPVLSDFDQTVWNDYGYGYGRPLTLVINQHMVILWKQEGYLPGLEDVIAQIEDALPHPPLGGPVDPVDGEPAWFPTPPVLNWSDSPSVGTNHDVTNYSLQVALDPEFSQVILDQVTADAQSELAVSSDLFLGSTQYYWRVRASDDGGGTWGTWSAVWSFTTHESFAVELASFCATWGGASRVHVEWATLSETDAYGFHVLRAPSGTGAYRRVTAHAIPAVGTHATGAAYSYADHVPGPGAYSYVLEEVELTGVHNQYGPVDVIVGTSSLTLAISDNPADAVLTAHLHLPARTSAKLRLWDLGGRLLASEDLGVLAFGEHRVLWKLAAPIPPGQYTARLSAAGQHATAKVVITR